MEANILYPTSRWHTNRFGEKTQITHANVSSSCSCQFCWTKSRLTNPTHSPSAVSKRTDPSLPSALPSLQCSAFISILSSCALKNPYNCGLFCIWPLSPTTTTPHHHNLLPYLGWGDAAVHVLIQREMAFCLCCSPSQKVTQAYPCRIKPHPLL